MPIGEELILKGLHQLLPGEFYAAATRPPAVYRGNPFLIEVGLAYGGTSAAQRIPREGLQEMLDASDARTLRQFLSSSFDGIGADAADKIIAEAGLRPRVSPGKLEPEEIAKLHEAMRNVNLNEGQSMSILRYANRVPLQFQAGACAITQTVMSTNWRSYGLSQSRGSLPSGPVTLMVHMASVWVPFTSESKEAVASYPEIQKELRLALQSVGRKLAMFLQAARPREARRPAAADLLALSGRSGRRRERHQQDGPREALRAVAGSGEEADHRGRRAVGRPRPAHRRGRGRFRRERDYRRPGGGGGGEWGDCKLKIAN